MCAASFVPSLNVSSFFLAWQMSLEHRRQMGNTTGLLYVQVLARTAYADLT